MEQKETKETEHSRKLGIFEILPRSWIGSHPSITKASPSMLAYLFGTVTKTPAPKPTTKPSVKTK
jgi:hypothetical protein